MSAAELESLRADTPAWGQYAHFAHGSTSLQPRAVFDAMLRWQQLESQHGAHRAIALVREELDQARSVAATLIGARTHQIAFVDSASRSWALAFAAACDHAQAIEVIVSEHEWGGSAINLLHAHQQGRIGLHVVSVSDGESLLVKIKNKLETLANDSTARIIVSLPAVVMVDGSLIDLHGIAAEVHKHNGLLFVDASHAVGQFPVDVATIACDVLMFPARKWLRGPKGVSVLYLSDRALGLLGAPPTLEIAGAVWDSNSSCRPHDDARRFEVYEYHPGLRLGFKAAAGYALEQGLERIALRNAEVRAQLRARLAQELDLHAVSADLTAASAFLTYRISEGVGAADIDAPASQLMSELEQAGINASVITTQYARWAMTARGMHKLLRLTPHYITAETETEQLVAALRKFRALLA